jgi:hypothetical protein
MKCKFFSEVEHKDKLLALKWNSLQKHVNKKKVDKPMKWVKKIEWYISKNCKHSKNKTTYAFKSKEFVLQQMSNGLVGEKRKILVQFATLFYTLKHGRPMLEYEVHKDLFEFFNLEKNPTMH